MSLTIKMSALAVMHAALGWLAFVVVAGNVVGRDADVVADVAVADIVVDVVLVKVNVS